MGEDTGEMILSGAQVAMRDIHGDQLSRFNAGLCCTRAPGEKNLTPNSVELEFGPVRMTIPISVWERLVDKVQSEYDSFADTGKF